jgi:glutamyl/glutaminyl-tRNA synthetase
MQYFQDKIQEWLPASARYPEEYRAKAIAAVVERFTLITDLSRYGYFFETPDYQHEDSKNDFQKLYGPQATLDSSTKIRFTAQNCDPILLIRNNKIVHNLRMLLEHVVSPTDYSELEIAKHISEFLYQSPELKNQDVFHLLRYMVTARKSGPSITLTCVILGREEVLKRLACFSGL